MFVDVHQHFLWGVDDGPKSFEETQQMLREMARQGVSAAIATAHATPGRREFPLTTYRQHLYEAQAWCRGKGLDLELYPGAEIFYTSNTPRLLHEGQVPTLAQTRWVLVEFAPAAPYERLVEAARNLGIAGYNVLVAHVERYKCLRHGDRIRELRERYEVNMQMNAATLLTRHTPWEEHWIRKVIRAGWIDMLATDAHNTTTRPCCMEAGYEALEAKFGRETAWQLCVEGPASIWNG